MVASSRSSCASCWQPKSILAQGDTAVSSCGALPLLARRDSQVSRARSRAVRGRLGPVRWPDARGYALRIASRRPGVLAHATAPIAATALRVPACRHVLFLRWASVPATGGSLGRYLPGADSRGGAVGTAAR